MNDKKCDYQVSGYFALALMEAGYSNQEVKRIIAAAQMKMYNMTPEQAHRKAIEQMKKRRK